MISAVTMQGVTPFFRWGAFVGLACCGLAVGRAVIRRRPAVHAVLPELRNPILNIPLTPRGRYGLWVARRLPSPETKPRPGVEVASRSGSAGGGDVTVVTYEGPGRQRPGAAMLWIHGGGLVMGAPADGAVLCSRWADELGTLVVSVDYRLAPEHPFPSGLEDCYAALCWLHQQAGVLGVDSSRIAVGGDSAGGGLAAALCQLARDRGGPPICFQLLEYPMLDDRTVLTRDRKSPEALAWSTASNRFGWTSYLGRTPTEDELLDYASPARTRDLAGLPPAWVGVGDLDLFHDEDVEYARRLETAGVSCELDVVVGMYHGADKIAPRAPAVVHFRDRMTAALAAALGIANGPSPETQLRDLP
jgi:acetyl esterase/lipase